MQQLVGVRRLMRQPLMIVLGVLTGRAPRAATAPGRRAELSPSFQSTSARS